MYKHNIVPKLNKQRPDKNGLYSLRIRATVKRVQSYYPTGISIREDQWDEAAKEIVNHRNKVMLNATVQKKIADIEARFLEANLRGEQPLKFSSQKASNDFIIFCHRQLKTESQRLRNTTMLQKWSALNKLEGFRQSLPFGSITVKTLHDYEQHCRQLGNREGTVWSATKFFINMLNTAANQSLFNKKQIAGYRKPKYTDPLREHLTLAELDKIEAFVLTAPIERLRHVADWFLFACYTGFRYGDVKAFTKEKIRGGKILLRTEKTGTDVLMPIHPRLQKVLDRMAPDVYSDQKCNDYLKLVAAGAGIDKKITMHVARHTHAVIFLELGGTMEDLQKLLGHTKISTTGIYGKITDKRLDAAVAKVWG